MSTEKSNDKVEEMREALKDAVVALDDWLNTFAPEFCDAERVEEARNRLNANGHLYYIATVVQKCRKALS